MIRIPYAAVAAAMAVGALSGCPAEDKCADEEKISAYADLDDDGFGAGDLSLVCALEDGLVDNADDCDDTDPYVAPGVTESCNGVDDNCDGTPDEGLKNVVWYHDADGDGYGEDAKPLVVCAPPDDTWARLGGDCDDTNENVNPGETEVCNGGVDDDCDTLVDDDDDTIDVTSFGSFYPDLDKDGWPRQGTSILACEAPAGAAAPADFDGDGKDDFDCVDNNAKVNPAAQEVCNGGADDDCDGLRDDLDDSLDPSGQTVFPADADGDGDGDPVNTVMACFAGPGTGASNNTLDCNDADSAVNTQADEILCDLVDNDCDKLTNDDRDLDLDLWTTCNGDCADTNPERNPDVTEIVADGLDQNCDGMELCYVDADQDGSRLETTINVADPQCDDAGNARADAPLDCDDTNAKIAIAGDWESDVDQDGFGDGVVALTDQCTDPGPGYVLPGGELDCNDADGNISPAQTVDPCNDGVDADCNTLDSCATCLEWQQTGSTDSGVYAVRPMGGDTELDVWCDMATDGGGWTLVSSTTSAPNDQVDFYNDDLTTLSPIGGHPGVWGGLSAVITANSDMRFACKLDPVDETFTVDLSFYDTDWYSQMAVSTEAASCFSEAGAEDQPARRNNLTGEFKDNTDFWDATGVGMEGEDSCNSPDDFTVDFDNAGMDGNEGDGTDWGEDDTKPKCGGSNTGGAWFVFAREL